MRYLKEKRRLNSGFSLVELIVVILIMGVLAVTIAPKVISYISLAQRNICANNIVEIKNCHEREKAGQANTTLDEIVKDKEKIYFAGKMKCPTNGVYVAVVAEDGSMQKIVICTKHSNGSHRVNAQTYYIMETLLGMTPAERKEYLEIGNNNISNDTIREKILKELGGAYEGLSDNIQNKLTDKTKMYVKPMITWGSETSGGLKSNEYVLYANDKSDNSGNTKWAANVVFDPKTGTWYEYVNNKSKTYDLASKTYEQIMTTIKSNPKDWKAVN